MNMHTFASHPYHTISCRQQAAQGFTDTRHRIPALGGAEWKWECGSGSVSVWEWAVESTGAGLCEYVSGSV